jgi:hypothetical protein
MDIKSAKEYFKAWVDSDKRNGMTDDLAGYRVQAYEALQEKAEREKGCDYCKNEKDFLEGFGHNIKLIKGKMCGENQNCGNAFGFEINCCPNCGRKLGELKC